MSSPLGVKHKSHCSNTGAVPPAEHERAVGVCLEKDLDFSLHVTPPQAGRPGSGGGFLGGGAAFKKASLSPAPAAVCAVLLLLHSRRDSQIPK